MLHHAKWSCLNIPVLNQYLLIQMVLIPLSFLTMRHYATSQKVAGSNPDEVDFFDLPNPSIRTMALGSTQRLTDMCTRNFLGVKRVAGM
jgi:hypothetical protein